MQALPNHGAATGIERASLVGCARTRMPSKLTPLLGRQDHGSVRVG